MINPTPDFEWQEYFVASEKAKLHHLFDLALQHLSTGQSVLDLGCGVGHGTEFLAKHGLRVTAVDIHEEAIIRTKDRISDDGLTNLVQSDFRDLKFDYNSFDAISAVNCLYFLSPTEFETFWSRLVGWLKPGGIFFGQFMGPKDAWAYRDDYNTQTEQTVRSLLLEFDIVHFHDDDRDTVIVTGKPNHVHVIHVIGRKRIGDVEL